MTHQNDTPASRADQVVRVGMRNRIQKIVLNDTLETLDQAPEFVSLGEQMQGKAEAGARFKQKRMLESVEQPKASASGPTL